MGIQITDEMIRLRTFHELDFNLSLDVFGDSISSFRQQCLKNVFGQGYEIHEGLLHKVGEVDDRPISANCALNGSPDNPQAILVSISDRTDKVHREALANWAQGLAEKYRCRYGIRQILTNQS